MKSAAQFLTSELILWNKDDGALHESNVSNPIKAETEKSTFASLKTGFAKHVNDV